MFCPKCGANNQDNESFCKRCGYAFTPRVTASGDTEHYGSPASDTIPLYDSLKEFFSDLIASYKEIARKNILIYIIPAIILAIVTYFGLYNYVIYLISVLGEGFSGGLSDCTSQAGSICNIAGFSENSGALVNAFSYLLVPGLFIGYLIGTIRSLGISKYLSQASHLVRSISQTFGQKRESATTSILVGTGLGFIVGSFISGTLLLTLPILGLLINSLIAGSKGMLTPILQYAHRDVIRKRSGQASARLIEPGVISIGVAGCGLGYAIGSVLLANNGMVALILGICIAAVGGYLLFGRRQGSKVVAILVVIIMTGLLLPAVIPVVRADDGGVEECGGNWDECAGADRVKEEASKSAAAGAAGIATGVVVGGVAGVAAKAAEMARRRKEAKKGEEDKEEGPIGYILQLSKDTLKVSDQKSDSFTATVWRVEKDGSYSPESSASIEVSVPDIAGLMVSPASGTGSLSVAVSLSEPTDASSTTLTVTASAGGETISSSVSVTFEASMQVGFE